MLLKILMVYYVYYNICSIVGVNNEFYFVYGDWYIVWLEVLLEYLLKLSIFYMVIFVWYFNIKWKGEL